MAAESLLSSLATDANVAVIGASGGIGRAFVNKLIDDSRVASLYAFSRSQLTEDSGKLIWHEIDIEVEDSIRAAAATTEGVPLDLVVVTAGILHEGEHLRPETSFKKLDAESMRKVFAINTIGPALVARYFLPNLRARRKAVFAALSARVGSIGDNRLGGWSSYRASKAALNMYMKTIALEQTRRRPQSIVVSLHPGTVATELSAPFTRRSSDRQVFTPEQSAGYLLEVIDQLSPADSGGFFAWDGQAIEY
jgi:NAD(P)-dependent dehydrogenase (short-subunit alcohol dehydrogenase family)